MVSLVEAALAGVIAGLIPVYLGFIPLLFVKKVSEMKKIFFISFAVGVLFFLFVEVAHEAIELGEEAGGIVGPALFIVGLLAGILALVAVELIRNKHRKYAAGPLFMGYLVALGIGIHNFGEGLAIGSSFAAGSLSLGTLLVIGFALHNGTEGLGIIGATGFTVRNLKHFALMGFIAGFPTAIGSIIGVAAYSQLLGVLFFAIATGAVLYVIAELIPIAYTREHKHLVFYGLLAGIILMYVTDVILESWGG